MNGLIIALTVLASVSVVLLLSIAGTLGDIKKAITSARPTGDQWDAALDQINQMRKQAGK